MSTLLGQSLVRHHGQELLDRVEEVRLQTKAGQAGDPGAAAQVRELLGSLPLEVATDLVRAFAAYFHLANAAEQVHRVRSLTDRSEGEGWLESAVTDIAAAGGADLLAASIAELDVRPVFTAHPTEASRRSVLTKIRRLSDELALATEGETVARRRQDRRLAELVDLIWQTDELRQNRPTPMDEARNAMYYLDEVLAETVPDLLGDLADLLDQHGVPVNPRRPPVRFGSWIGGDRDGNPYVTPETTAEVLRLQHQHAIKLALGMVDVLVSRLSSSTVIVEVDPELEASLARDLDNLPGLDPRVKELNAAEPYRLKLTCIKAKLLNTERRVLGGTPHEPGRDYADTAELLDDLDLVADSLRAHGGALVADGALARVSQTLAGTGLHLATLDVREHAEVAGDSHTTRMQNSAAIDDDHVTLLVGGMSCLHQGEQYGQLAKSQVSGDIGKHYLLRERGRPRDFFAFQVPQDIGAGSPLAGIGDIDGGDRFGHQAATPQVDSPGDILLCHPKGRQRPGRAKRMEGLLIDCLNTLLFQLDTFGGEPSCFVARSAGNELPQCSIGPNDTMARAAWPVLVVKHPMADPSSGRL